MKEILAILRAEYNRLIAETPDAAEEISFTEFVKEAILVLRTEFNS